MNRNDFQFPCSVSDESDDDVLSMGGCPASAVGYSMGWN